MMTSEAFSIWSFDILPSSMLPYSDVIFTQFAEEVGRGCTRAETSVLESLVDIPVFHSAQIKPRTTPKYDSLLVFVLRQA